VKKLVLLLLLGLSTTSMGLTVSRITTPPKIDGNLDESFWQAAESAEMKEYKGGAVKNRTTVQMAYDDSTLYVGFTCYESRMDQLKTVWSHPEERDNSIWDDDCVELYLDPFGSSVHYFQIIINSAGVTSDGMDGEMGWNPKLTVGAVKADDHWTVEVAIPFADLGYRPKGGEVWKGNLCREEKPANELSCLYPTMGTFLNFSKFGPLVFQPKEGEAVFALTRLYEGKLTGKVSNDSASAKKYKIVVRSLEDLKPVSEASTEVSVPASKMTAVALTYKPTAKASALDVEVVDLSESRTVYRNQFELLSIVPKPQLRVWQVDKPLYKELWSDEPTGLVKEGAIFWAHGRNYGPMRLWASQYGKRYVYEEYFSLLAKHKLWPITSNDAYINPHFNLPENDRKYGVKQILQADPRGGPFPTIDGGPLLFDPEVVNYYVTKTLKEIKEGGDGFWAVSYGDEIYEIQEGRAVDMFETMKDSYPYIRQLDQEVMQNYGGGKYGLPQSKNDKDPYRWIAFRKWQNDKYADLFVDFYKRIKDVNPKIPIISPDPTAMHHPYDFSRWGQFSDILTHQLYPRRSSNRATFGFHTKLVKDLSGMEEIWPCLHVENYGASFTPQEALELISQAFRNGATGFHYYLCDTIGRYAKKGYMQMEYYGAPERWQVETDVMDEVRQMNKLRFPAKADCAILYSCDSYASQPPGSMTDEVEVAYTFVGPVAGSWFKFIDDYQIDRGTVNLADFKVIYIPFATFQQESVIAKLAEYVEKGGIVVCGDPEAFSHDALGNDMSSWRKKLFGVELGGTITPGSISYQNAKLPVYSRAYGVKPLANTTVLASFASGNPAIVGHTFGKGRTLFFCANPFRVPTLGDSSWKAYFTKLQKNFGLVVNEDIWRFRFPESLIKPQPKPTGECLTNNHIFWESCKPLSLVNVDTEGTYSYSFAPDAIGDEGGQADVSFERGDLTDRRKAFTAGNVDLGTSKLEEWIVRYGKTDPAAITFDFKKAYPVEKVVLFYTGQLPEVTVEISTDGQAWQPFASAGAKPATEDVYDLTLAGSPTSARYVRLNFGSRTEKKDFTLAELEVWAK
jgi:hypothetical protein